MSTATLPPPTSERRSEPMPIAYPLFVNNPCLWYPHGVRNEGDARPCIMLSRENHCQITLLEFRYGENAVHRYVRHVDDAWLEANPSQRLARGEKDGGAWDYVDGIAYSFQIPGRHVEQQGPQTLYGFPMDVARKVFELRSTGKTPAEIAGSLAIPGLKSAVVEKMLSHNQQ